MGGQARVPRRGLGSPPEAALRSEGRPRPRRRQVPRRGPRGGRLHHPGVGFRFSTPFANAPGPVGAQSREASRLRRRAAGGQHGKLRSLCAGGSQRQLGPAPGRPLSARASSAGATEAPRNARRAQAGVRVRLKAAAEVGAGQVRTHVCPECPGPGASGCGRRFPPITASVDPTRLGSSGDQGRPRTAALRLWRLQPHADPAGGRGSPHPPRGRLEACRGSPTW